MARRGRRLTEEEKTLWAHVVRHVEPMRPDPGAQDNASAVQAPAGPDAPDKATPSAGQAGGKVEGVGKNVGKARRSGPGTGPRLPTASPYRPMPPPGPAIPAVAGLERRERIALRRGRRHVDAKLDLHGMRQEEAHLALAHFIRQARARDHALVLIVTGKGAAPSDGYRSGGHDERGVLRRMVPHWLRGPDLRPLVVGFEEAALHHGGAGAIYVRLRRRQL